MIKKLKYITAILLLAVFPISAIGLNVTIFKCLHKNTINISFFNTNTFNANLFVCKCFTAEKNISKKVHHSCCEAKKIQEKETNIQNLSSNKESGLNYHSSPCCLNSNKIIALNSVFVSLENQINTIELPVYSNNLLSKIDLKDIYKFHSKIIVFPLKGPIFNIISFIHFNSACGDDTEAFSLHIC
ncbi:MAG: hypothetical protein ABSG15_07510 [FCB group bacterium]|jgi:hypothetical protein